MDDDFLDDDDDDGRPLTWRTAIIGIISASLAAILTHFLFGVP